jgi:hypothetical protein
MFGWFIAVRIPISSLSASSSSLVSLLLVTILTAYESPDFLLVPSRTTLNAPDPS